jgi:hypothetical protein
MDESYIHEHYHCNDDSICDPTDKQDVQIGKNPAKGRRYCFAAAFTGPNPKVENPTQAEDKAGLVPRTVWSFCPRQWKDHQGNYHEVFNGKIFVHHWSEQLLPISLNLCLL